MYIIKKKLRHEFFRAPNKGTTHIFQEAHRYTKKEAEACLATENNPRRYQIISVEDFLKSHI